MKTILCLLIMSASLRAETKVLLFSGSTREGSYNQKLIMQAEKMARAQGAQTTLISLKDFEMPFYNGDLEEKTGMPENAKRLGQLMAEHDVIVIATPEYNGSIPGLLKNAIDWMSRDAKRAMFKGKKFSLMSAAGSAYGGKNAMKHLADILGQLGGVVEIKASVPRAYEAFNEKGELKDISLLAK
jgi:chromate reductase, NAD(P)H dehydrogenase (quinone)